MGAFSPPPSWYEPDDEDDENAHACHGVACHGAWCLHPSHRDD